MLLRLQWCEDGYTLRLAVESIYAQKRGLKRVNVRYSEIPNNDKLRGLKSVYIYRNESLEKLLTETPNPGIVIEQARLLERYNKEVLFTTKKPAEERWVDLTEPLARLEQGQQRWPKDTRLLSARATMFRSNWEYAEAEKLYDALRRRERSGPFRRRATLDLCQCLLWQLTFQTPARSGARPATLTKLGECLDYLRPWPNFASEVAALNVRYHIEAGKADAIGGLDGVFDAVVGKDKPFAEQLQVFLHSVDVQADEEASQEVLAALREDCTDLMVLRTLGWSYYRWSELIEPGLEKLKRAYKAFDAVRLLETSWRRNNKPSVATCICLGLVGLAAMKLARSAVPFGPLRPSAHIVWDWLTFVDSNLQSAQERSVGRCHETVKGYLAELCHLKRSIRERQGQGLDDF
jgi:hypothetical protein